MFFTQVQVPSVEDPYVLYKSLYDNMLHGAPMAMIAGL